MESFDFFFFKENQTSDCGLWPRLIISVLKAGVYLLNKRERISLSKKRLEEAQSAPLETTFKCLYTED